MQVNHGVMIDRVEPVGKYQAADVVVGFRFNAYFWSEHEGIVINDLYTRGFRVHDGLIKAPSYVGKGGTWPNIFLPRVWASELADLILGNENLKKQFPNLYPLLPKETLVSNLEFPVTLYKREFPELGRIRGFLGTQAP